MMTTMYQLAGMVRVELIRHWRRRGLPLVMLLWLIGLLGSGILMQDTLLLNPAPEMLEQSEAFRRFSTTLTIIGGTVLLSVSAAVLLLAVMAAETIPVDRQLGVSEWVEALPTGHAMQLAAKLLGVWTGVILSMVGLALVGGVFNYWLMGPFEVSIYAGVWLMVIAPLALFFSGISLMAAANFRSRRTAVFVGILVGVGSYLFVMPSVISFLAAGYARVLAARIDALTAEVCRTLPDSCSDLGAMLDTTLPQDFTQYYRMLLLATVLMAAGTTLAWGWRVWQERRGTGF